MTETIFALATAPGRGAVSVIRLSGPGAKLAVERLTGQQAPLARRAVLRRLNDPQTALPLDQALVLVFEGPASFTGEDVAELHLHGGRAVSAAVLAALERLPGLRHAEAGEFTRRGFQNGKFDLTAAEAVGDLVEAQTGHQRLQAVRQLAGALLDVYGGWADRLAGVLAHLEADLDFPDEDLPDGVADQAWAPVAEVVAALRRHLADGGRAERLRDGVTVAIIGPPNAGKSLLMNRLAGREVAIVSAIAGTTRDVIEVALDLDGYPVTLLDTAGLRDSDDPIEREGVARARARADQADLRLLVSAPDAPLAGCPPRAGDIVVWNKADLAEPPGGLAAAQAVSARTGAGLDRLLAALSARLAALMATEGEGIGPTRARHRAAAGEALAALERAMAAPTAELRAEDVRLAVRSLGRITGRVDVEDLLDRIFRDFCIGK